MIEILVIFAIITVLMSLGFVGFIKIKENVFDKEAAANLKSIRVAQESYKMSMGTYYPESSSVSDIPSINDNLKLSLVSGAERAWNYTLWDTGCAQADRLGYDDRSWYLTINDTGVEPDPGSCP